MDNQALGAQSDLYLDAYSYIADQHSIQVDLKVDAPCAGYLDSEAAAHGIADLARGARMTVPLAAATLLTRLNLVNPQMPAALSADGLVGSVMKNFSRQSCCLVDLKAVSPVFFEYSALVTALLRDQKLEESISTLLVERMRACNRLIAHDVETTARPKVGTSAIRPSACLFETKMRALGLPQRVTQLSSAQTGDSDTTRGEACGLDTQQISTFLQGLTISESRVLQERRRNLELH
eukprot:Protomagalhaensia_wolfi_Nauph_80__3046@NODE_3120_length_885_cov_3_430260_g2445_i0_p1_GENE_NODE_3120_length_885_cov_3_430260_g2445_i0NODE_3120_length_885_cov_3_430260_g2445_i0_p1_ORF_typecomplete_len236_score17_79Sld5/PF05916_11/0_18_NODE_3120_length_885_cov_3_430260_g2445_i0151858